MFVSFFHNTDILFLLKYSNIITYLGAGERLVEQPFVAEPKLRAAQASAKPKDERKSVALRHQTIQVLDAPLYKDNG